MDDKIGNAGLENTIPVMVEFAKSSVSLFSNCPKLTTTSILDTVMTSTTLILRTNSKKGGSLTGVTTHSRSNVADCTPFPAPELLSSVTSIKMVAVPKASFVGIKVISMVEISELFSLRTVAVGVATNSCVPPPIV